MGNPNLSRPCKPDCKCGRHTAVHKPDCKCCRCGGAKYPSDYRPYRAPKRDDRCVCNHIKANHDSFGCKTCERKDFKQPEGHPVCTEYRPANEPKKMQDNSFAREVHREGFITHIGEIATCSNCWEPCKIGFAHTVACVINARAHAQRCRSRLQSDSGRSRSNRAK